MGAGVVVALAALRSVPVTVSGVPPPGADVGNREHIVVPAAAVTATNPEPVHTHECEGVVVESHVLAEGQLSVVLRVTPSVPGQYSFGVHVYESSSREVVSPKSSENT